MIVNVLKAGHLVSFSCICCYVFGVLEVGFLSFPFLATCKVMKINSLNDGDTINQHQCQVIIK